MSDDHEKSSVPSRDVTLIAGKYRLERLLGKGGMGAVYEVTHTGIDRKFALKLMHASEQAPDSEARFEREARAAGRIGHPNIVDVFDFGKTDEGAPYIVMELCAGESLAERLIHGPLEAADACEVAIEMLNALEAAHGAGIVHRDVKPANVFLVPSANGKSAVKVLDFGIAKFVEGDVTLTSTGAVIGSPLYMAPEQVRAEKDVDARVDIWAVGATLYEMLSGIAPHRAPSHAAVIARIVTIPAASLRTHVEKIDPQLDAIVLRALSIEKNDRFETAAAMRVALDNYVSGSAATMASLPPLGVSQSHASPPSHVTPNRIWIIGLGLFLAAVAIAFFALHSRSSGTQASVATAPSSSPSASVAIDPQPSAVATTAAQENPTASANGISDPPAPAKSAKPVAAAHPVATHLAQPPSPTCASGEQISLGHCCRVGLVWQNDRCDRPLATTAPF